MSNPFETTQHVGAPSGSLPTDPPVIAFADVLGDALGLLGRGGPTLALGVFLYSAVCIPTVYVCGLGLFLGPIVYWGLTRVSLDLGTDAISVRSLTSGFSRIGHSWSQMAMFAVAWFVLMLPAAGAAAVAAIVGRLLVPSLGAWGPLLLASPITAVWTTVLMCRFSLMPLLMVDRDVQALDALSASWRLTAPSWPTFMLAGAAGYFALLPSVLASNVAANGALHAAVGVITRLVPDLPPEVFAGSPSMFPPMAPGALAVLSLLLVSAALLLHTLGWVFQASLFVAAYRRVVSAA